MKGELQVSLEEIGQLTGSTVKTVNPPPNPLPGGGEGGECDSMTGTLLGSWDGNRFTRYTGDVLQSDYNAACNILARGTDELIHRYMKYEEVQEVLLRRTVRFPREPEKASLRDPRCRIPG
jgi:transposase